MAKVESKNKQNPKLVQSELQDGRASLALEYYLGRNETPVLDENGNHVLYTEGAMKGKPKYRIKHIRKREVLNLYIWLHPRNQQERTQNKNTLALAEKIRFEREQEFLEDREGYRLKKDGENDFIKYFRKHWENELYSKPVRTTYKTSYNRFMRFLEATPRFQRYTSFLRMELITPEMVTSFTDYLKKVAKGEGAHKSYYMFRTVILHAIEEGLMKKNPCKGIVIHRDVNTLKKEILTMDEIKRLAATHYEGEDTALQRAFLFCCFTGIRWCDTVSLTHANVDFFLSRENLELKFKARREKQQAATAQPQQQRQSQSKPKQPEPIVIPPLPDVVCGVKIDRLRQQAYQEGKFISIGICDPGGVIPINHWIWYDFDKREPVMSRTYPYDHKIPEAFQRQLASKQSPASSSQGAGIRLSSPSLGGNIPEEQGFACGGGVPDVIGSAASLGEDFKHFLEMHPGMSIEEALHRFRNEQKHRSRVRLTH